MIDSLAARWSVKRDIFTDDYRPDQAVTSRQLVNEKGKNLHVLFPPWHGGGVAYRQLQRRLAKRGDAVLAYGFHDEILRPNSKNVVDSFEHLSDKVAVDLDEVVENHDYERVRLVAMSLGNPAMSLTTSKFDKFDSTVHVTSGNSFAPSMWQGIRTQHIRTGIEAEGHTVESLQKLWSSMDPDQHLGALAGKDVTLIVSTTDQMIPACYQENLVAAAQDAGINPTVQRTRLGHYATIGRFCFSEPR